MQSLRRKRAIALKEQTDALNLENKAMRQELQLLKDRNQHVRALEKSFNDTEAQREAISQENDTLQFEMLELHMELQDEAACTKLLAIKTTCCKRNS